MIGPSSPLERACLAMLDERGLIRTPILIVFLMVSALTGCALGYLAS